MRGRRAGAEKVTNHGIYLKRCLSHVDVGSKGKSAGNLSWLAGKKENKVARFLSLLC